MKQTDAIFAHVQGVHRQAAGEEQTLRPSLDGKAAAPIGPFSRGGPSRTGTRGADHDFKPEGAPTPFGIFRPRASESELFFTDSEVSSDFMADCLEGWIRGRAETLQGARKPILDPDDGPGNGGQRGRWLLRMALLAQKYRWAVVLVYYPPYPSKYNPIGRLWASWRTTGAGSYWTARPRCWATPRT